ncbi:MULTISPECIES: conjugal transfer protein TraJ [unclassified Bartonella]|uniref:conjugal transfer protein TraJ n=1 Tax=unclassified Bartonella TaxID=2645622 RepID=UPI00099B0E2B|nr:MULTISPECIES: conjugal transfer protein TraJ [unclassified Bartonella]AQX27877.1 hypothetical protein BJB15x_004670 [Bartonella sp. JB15]AQX27897.1 hypothetical protein BJB15x_004870 [Bartonella sp. JB15]AQX29157.1 hypothetical protein BJB63x_004650 [Bartonella sp. JB63]AQX29177.1 hypothetical protein BJB63x_004850 [Bartonella sp. JB63]
MKLKITIILTFMIALTGCALKSGPPKLPRCNGQNVRVLNQGKWNKWSWSDENVLQHNNTAVKPVPTPIILNTLENEVPKAHVGLNTPPLDSINHQASSYKNAEITHEK